MTCLREMEKIKTFLEDKNSWWKILKGRKVDCCQQKLPHLHGVLDGLPVTLMLLEDGTDEVQSLLIYFFLQIKNEMKYTLHKLVTYEKF